MPGQGTGPGLADLLLGQISTAALATRFHANYRNRYYGYFLNDNWKISRKLTLNLGLRWELQTPYWEHLNQQGNFDLDPHSPTYGTIVAAGGSSILSRTFSDRDRNNFGPRFGFAYELNPKTVIRAACHKHLAIYRHAGRCAHHPVRSSRSSTN